MPRRKTSGDQTREPKMKKFILAFLALFLVVPALADQTDRDRNAAYDQARNEYRLYLQQLKELNRQYKEVTGEIGKIIKEEGLPTWDAGDMVLGADLGGEALSNFGDTDVQETDTEIIVTVDLPGLKKNEVKVSIVDHKALKIQGEREASKEKIKESAGIRFYKSERQYGEFEKLIELPSTVQDQGTEAKYEDGVLTVRILKEPGAQKEVAVTVH